MLFYGFVLYHLSSISNKKAVSSGFAIGSYEIFVLYKMNGRKEKLYELRGKLQTLRSCLNWK